MQEKQKYFMYQMKDYNKVEKQQIPQLQKISQQVLPNVLNLLGEFSRSSFQFHLPKYSRFYLSPTSNITFAYNLLYFLAFYIMQIQISLILAFGTPFSQSQFSNSHFDVMYWFVYSFLVFDIFVSFNKGYYLYGKGKVCDNRNKIIQNYLKTQFYFDVLVLAFLIVPQASYNQNINFLALISIILMWIKKFKYQNEIVSILQYQKVPRIVFILTSLFLDMLLLGHFGACIFTGIDIALWNVQYYGSNTIYYWISDNTNYTGVDLFGSSWYLIYIYAQSFSTGTLSTLAPGPFVRNPIQVSYALFVMIYFMLLASYVGQVLINILYSYQIKRVFHEQSIQDFDKYMTLKSIKQNLKTRIYNFFQLIWDVESRMQTQQQKVCINLLPLHLKQQLLLEMSFVKSFFLFRYISTNDSRTLQKQLALKINRIIVDSQTCLFRQGTLLKRQSDQSSQCLNNIYYLSRGMVKYYLSLQYRHVYSNVSQPTSFFNYNYNQPQSKSQNSLADSKNVKDSKDSISQEYLISMSNNDKYIGLYEFITKKSIHYCCKAVDLCEFDSITRKDFMDIIRLNKQQYQEVYNRLRHQLLVENKLSIIHKVCSVCYEDHIQELCPIVNIKERIRRNLLIGQKNIGRSCARSQRFDRNNKQKNGNKIATKSKSVFMKSKPKLKMHEQQSAACQIFNLILQDSSIKLQDLLMSAAKTDQIQYGFAWTNYYPQDNVDKLNYFLPTNMRQQSSTLNQSVSRRISLRLSSKQSLKK